MPILFGACVTAAIAILVFAKTRKGASDLEKKLLASNGETTPPELGRVLDDERVREGRAHLRRSGVLMCGLARNGEAHIDAALHNLYASVVPNFARYKILVLENDSTDATRDRLLRWSERDENLLVLGGGTYNARVSKMDLAPSTNHLPEMRRIEKMVLLRNMLLDEIEKEQWDDYEYVMMVDFDLVGVLYQDGLCDTGYELATKKEVDAVCALGIEFNRTLGTFKFFDPYAFSDAKTANMTMKEKDSLLQSSRGLVDRGMEKVRSSFGGLTVYRRSSLSGRRYSTRLVKGKEPICEHVGLHETLGEVRLNNECLFVLHVSPHLGKTHLDLPARSESFVRSRDDDPSISLDAAVGGRER